MKISDAIKYGSLIGKYLLGKEKSRELEELKKIVEREESNRLIFSQLKNEKHISEKIDEYEKIDRQKAWQKYSGKLAFVKLEQTIRKWKIAAVIFMIIGIGSLSGILRYEFSSTDSGKLLYTTFTTPLGQNSKIVLPDQSVVWLNSGTTITYNNHFSIDNRDVEIEGQAFFQVEHNEELPLIVNCRDLNVTVLGTKFDVNAYPDHTNIEIVLQEGKVELTHDNYKSFRQILNPGEKLEFDTENVGLNVSQVDIYKYTSWKDGILIFKNDPMNEVLEKLERWYNIKIDVRNKEIYNLVFNATIVNQSVEEIFELIRYTCSVEYQIIHSKDPEIPEKVILSN
ncbi:FecR family protein [Sunxiuqinia sp. A32]|uniref:FecR family protein n=1 Tax=Sunxiuqinia sp. A32 TaxID=3461496 RepID=UPI004045B51E